MKHRVGFNRLGRTPAHRKALHRNMVTSLFRHERIRTTKTKAQAIRRTAEKMITRAKVDSVHNRRMVARDIKDKTIISKLFVEIAPRLKERPGGYTRVLKVGFRKGDAAEMVLLELVGTDERAGQDEKKSRRASRKSAADASSQAGAATKTAAGEKKKSGRPKKTEAVDASVVEKADRAGDGKVAEAPETEAAAAGVPEAPAAAEGSGEEHAEAAEDDGRTQ